MIEYKIQEGQTVLDIVNQLYTNLDSISTIMLNNEKFDINSMNDNEVITIPDEVNNQTRNEIVNNNYTFINQDNIVHTLVESIIVNKGIYNLSDLYPSLINTGTYNIQSSKDIFEYQNESGYITSNKTIYVFNDNSILNIYEEKFTI